MAALMQKTWLDEHAHTLPQWQRDAYQAFVSTIADDANTYPCVPGRQGFLTNNLRFCFIGDPRCTEAAQQLAKTLQAYGKCSRDTGKFASLVVFCETPKAILENYDVEGFRQLFWSLLNHMTTFDEKAWPADIPTDPHHHKWEFCFDGEPYFAFCATPAHDTRKSRHFPCFLLAFQPRWVLDEINENTPFGRKIKNVIRQRLVKYDGIPGHPDLKWYGNEDNYEWKQYFISDDDTSPSKCPFHRMRDKFFSN